MPYVDSAGTRIYWTEQGAGSPVLLIMGLSYTHEMWFRLVGPLAERHRVILYDNRGVGRSGVPNGPYLIRTMAEDARAVLDAAGVRRAQVVGASMGGMVAQELALRYPERLSRLLLGCTSHGGLLARWPRFLPPRGMKWQVAHRFERELALAPLLYARGTPMERILEDVTIQCGCAWSYKGFLNQFAGVLLWSSYLRLPRLRLPVTVVHGDSDRLVPPQNGRVLAARIPGARFQLIPHAGHILLTDQPELCIDMILNSLEIKED